MRSLQADPNHGFLKKVLSRFGEVKLLSEEDGAGGDELGKITSKVLFACRIFSRILVS